MGLIGTILSFGAACLSIAAHGGRFSEHFDVLTHFAPIYAAAGALALMFSLTQRRSIREILFASGSVGLASALWLMAPEALSASGELDGDPSPSGRITIVQFNAWGGNARANEAVRWILAQRPDVVFLQEGGRLRDALALGGEFYVTCGSCASLILTRSAPVGAYAPARRGDERGLLTVATLNHERGPFTVMSVHRHWPVRFTKAADQTVELEALMARHERRRMVVGGDFNSTPWSFARRREDISLGLVRRTRMLPTWPAERVSHNRLPAPFPYLPIDHVYAGSDWATVSVERGPRLGSDHYPVVVTLAPVGR